MKVNLLDTKGNKSGDTNLPKDIFGIQPNLEVLRQYLHVYKTNQRQGTSSTKTRGEVSGSGAKPFAQKHTGRARAGEKRNPIWRKGGVAHGPKPKSWTVTMPFLMKNLALVSALSIQGAKGRISVAEKITLDQAKTSDAKEFIKNSTVKGKTLVILGDSTETTQKSFANLKGVSTALVTNLNAYEVLNARSIILDRSAVDFLKDKYSFESEK